MKVIKKLGKKLLHPLNLDIVRLNASPQTYFEIDDDFKSLYAIAQEKTQMAFSDNLLRRQRHYTLNHLFQQVDVSLGNVAECGCWRGLSSYQLSTHLKCQEFKNTFYIFDSFQGLSEFQDIDFTKNGIKDIDARRKWFACSLDSVRDNLKEFDFIEYKKGWIPARFAEVENEKFIFVHIDVDLYQPIKDALEFFYSRTLKSGIIVLDDYGAIDFPGAKKAVDEFLQNKKDFFLPLPSGQAFLVKD